jgi:hypothetical protein
MVKRWLRAMLVCGCCLLPAAARGQAAGPGEAKAATMGATDPADGALSPELAQTVQDIINLTNGLRQAKGLQPVRPNPTLMRAAQGFSRFMASTDQFGHTADGSSPAERAERHGYDPCIISENIAYEYSTAGFLSEGLARKILLRLGTLGGVTARTCSTLTSQKPAWQWPRARALGTTTPFRCSGARQRRCLSFRSPMIRTPLFSTGWVARHSRCHRGRRVPTSSVSRAT